MTLLNADYFKCGDIVSVHFHESWLDTWVTGRVLSLTKTGENREQEYTNTRFEKLHKTAGCEHLFDVEVDSPGGPKKQDVRVAVNQPHQTIVAWMPRVYPLGMPIYKGFQPERIRLLAHDPDWDPFAVKPPASAELNRGRGIYLTGAYYQVGDPVWAWEESDWRPATVVNTDRWVSVVYLGNFRDSAGNRSKSYRTWQIWPVMSESSAILSKDLERPI